MPNVAEKSLWHKLLDKKVSRRTVIQSVVAAGVAGGFRAVNAQGAAPTGDYNANNGALSLPYVIAEGTGELLTMLQQLDIDHRNAARQRFDQSLASGGRTVAWCELHGEPLVPGFAAQALWADLLVLGQHDPADPMTTGVPACSSRPHTASSSSCRGSKRPTCTCTLNSRAPPSTASAT